MDRKAKLFSTRTIRTELADPAYKDGLLSVPDFIKAREFEIKSFELSQLKTKYASSNRVFQNLPRSMRRRTASHNVKRVPKRLRNRAIREMQDTNVVKPKNSAKQLYRLKMSKKLLKLASRIKLMKQVPNTDSGSIKSRIKSLNEQIQRLNQQKSHGDKNKPPLNNVLGSIDNTGVNELAKRPSGNIKYSNRQKQFVWLTTHVWHAKRFHMMKRWGYQIPLSPTQKCFRIVNRLSRNHSLISDTSYFDTMIIDYDLHMLEDLINGSKSVYDGSKSYNDWLYVKDQDKRIVIGKGMVYCNQTIGKVLIRVHPTIYEELFNYLRELYPNRNAQDCRYSLGSIDIIGPESLKTLNKIFYINSHNSDDEFKEIFKNLSKYNDTLRKGTVMAFNIKDPRLWAYPKCPPIKTPYDYNDIIIKLSKGYVNPQSINQLFEPSGRYDSYKDQLSTKQLNKGINPNDIEAMIPVLLTKLTDNHWTLILPWYWILPLWIKLNRVSHVHAVGLKQLNQINFENNQLSYPQDYPYLPEGWINNELEIKLTQMKYDKLPKSKQQFLKYERGLLPFGCDWEFLHKLYYLKPFVNGKLPDKNLFSNFNPETYLRHMNSVNDLVNNINDMRDYKLCIEVNHQSQLELKPPKIDNLSQLPRLPVQLIRVQVVEGSLKDGARIYRGDGNVENLIGFITSGGFNLRQGCCTGVGYVISGSHITSEDIVVRNIGTSNTHKVIVLP